MKPIPLEKLEEVAALAAEPEAIKTTPNGAGLAARFDIDDWVAGAAAKMGWNITGPNAKDGAREWRFKYCPFQPDYRDGNAAIRQNFNGRLEYHCFCADHPEKSWRDLRELVDGPRRAPYAPPDRSDDDAKPMPRAVGLQELIGMKLQQPTFLVGSIITTPGCWLMIGASKSNKTLLTVQLLLSCHAPQAFLDWYEIPKAVGALMVEQDDPAGLTSLQAIITKSQVTLVEGRFHAVAGCDFTIGENLFSFLRHEIREKNLGIVALDSYTTMRGRRGGGCDIVRAELDDFRQLDQLAKEMKCVIIVIHHESHGSRDRDFSERGAGTYAVAMATEGQIYVSRFGELPSNAPERLIQIRGRRVGGTEFVVRFRPDTLDHEFVIEGAAAGVYPTLRQIQNAFGVANWSPKTLSHETGLARATVTRLIARLVSSGVVRRTGFGEYCLAEKVA